MARGSSIEEITREQLNALKDKFELVQGDRRAFFDTYETTKKNNEVRTARGGSELPRAGPAPGLGKSAAALCHARRRSCWGSCGGRTRP